MTMPQSSNFVDRYKTGDTPWDTGRPDANLIKMIEKWPIGIGTALEVGCGYGHSSLWLAKRGFAVTGLDLSSVAIEKAKQNASTANLHCTFLEADFLATVISDGPFDFAFDRGCFHVYDLPEERKHYAKKIADHLEEGGLWLTLAGSADDPPRDHGPPRLSANNITDAVEPFFEILSLKAGHFDSIRSEPPRAWICLMRKRAASVL
jgi:SAM-dependent methyltransferase